MQIKSVLNGKEINLTGDNTTIKSNNFNVDKDGNMSCKNATMDSAKIVKGSIEVGGTQTQSDLCVKGSWFDNNTNNLMYPGATRIKSSNGTLIDMQILGHNNIIQGGIDLWCESSDDSTHVYAQDISTPILIQTSLESQKKNFEKLQDNALEIIKTIDIYKYNLKSEKDTDKKHIGFVIGDNYNYSKEVTSLNNTGVDNYSFTSLCCKAIQEQQKVIEKLQNKIEEMEEKINGQD